MDAPCGGPVQKALGSFVALGIVASVLFPSICRRSAQVCNMLENIVNVSWVYISEVRFLEAWQNVLVLPRFPPWWTFSMGSASLRWRPGFFGLSVLSARSLSFGHVRDQV